MIATLKRRFLLFLIGVLAAGCSKAPTPAPPPVQTQCTSTPGAMPGTFIWSCALPDGRTISFQTTQTP